MTKFRISLGKWLGPWGYLKGGLRKSKGYCKGRNRFWVYRPQRKRPRQRAFRYLNQRGQKRSAWWYFGGGGFGLLTPSVCGSRLGWGCRRS